MTTPHRFVEYQVSPIGKLAIRLVKQWRLRALMLTLAFLSLNTYGMGTITSIELAPTATVCDSDTGSPCGVGEFQDLTFVLHGTGKCGVVKISFGDGESKEENDIDFDASNGVHPVGYRYNTSVQPNPPDTHIPSEWGGKKTVVASAESDCVGEARIPLTVLLESQIGSGHFSSVFKLGLVVEAPWESSCKKIPGMKQLPANTVIQVSSPATDNNLRINFGCWFGGCIYNADGSIGSKARASFPFPGYRDYSLILRAGGQVVQGGTNVSFVTTNQTPSDLEFCLNDDSLSDNHGQWFIKLVVDESQAVSKPREAVTCNVSGLEPGGASRQSEAFYIADANSVCIPDGSAKGQCLPYFGGCGTASSVGDVSFRVFDDGGTNKSEPSGYLSFSTLNAACSTRSPYACRRWFGMASTSDGRKVQCYLFNDGMSNLVGPTDAIYYRGSGQVCMPDGSATGLCRKWFGNCEVTN